jgi:DNA primase
VPYISKTTIDAVNSRVDAVAVIGEYVRLEKRSGKYWGLCPFHDEKTPSFTVDPERKFYYCFGCHAGGGVVKFVMEMDKLSFPEAIEKLAATVGVDIVYEKGTGVSAQDRKAADEERKKNEEYEELFARLAKSFHYILLQTEEGRFARDYLFGRGVSPEIVDKFHLGYTPADRYWLADFLRKQGYSDKFLAESGLFGKGKLDYPFFHDRLMFPINDKNGKTVAFGGRILRGDGPKYLNSGDSAIYHKRETLYAIDVALPEIRRIKEVYICEGYMDAIAMHDAGLSNTVAPLGTAFTVEQARLLHRWAERIIMIFDSDEAGQKAAEKGIFTCRQACVACSIVQLPMKDPADILKESGKGGLTKIVQHSIIDMEFLAARYSGLFNTTDDKKGDGKARAIAALFPFLEVLESDSEVRWHACINYFADYFGVDEDAVIKDYRSRGQSPRPEKSGPENQLNAAEFKGNNELFLLTACFVNFETNPELYTKLKMSLPVEDIEDRAAKELYIAMEEMVRSRETGIDGLLARVRDESLLRFVTEKSARDEFSVKPEKLVEDAIRGVKKKKLEERRAQIVIELRMAKAHNADVTGLLDEKMRVDQLLVSN